MDVAMLVAEGGRNATRHGDQPLLSGAGYRLEA